MDSPRRDWVFHALSQLLIPNGNQPDITWRWLTKLISEMWIRPSSWTPISTKRTKVHNVTDSFKFLSYWQVFEFKNVLTKHRCFKIITTGHDLGFKGQRRISLRVSVQVPILPLFKIKSSQHICSLQSSKSVIANCLKRAFTVDKTLGGPLYYPRYSWYGTRRKPAACSKALAPRSWTFLISARDVISPFSLNGRRRYSEMVLLESRHRVTREYYGYVDIDTDPLTTVSTTKSRFSESSD